MTVEQRTLGSIPKRAASPCITLMTIREDEYFGPVLVNINDDLVAEATYFLSCAVTRASGGPPL